MGRSRGRLGLPLPYTTLLLQVSSVSLSHDRLVIMAPECFACLEGDRLRWTDRLDIICLGRCSCTNQVSSVSLSVLCRQRMHISPVTQKKKKNFAASAWLA